MTANVNESIAGGGSASSGGTVSNGMLVFTDGGNDYAALPVTPGGDISANIIPRTGTLATLLAANGGNGELGTATDNDAIVKFNSVAGGAVAFYKSGYRVINVDTDLDGSGFYYSNHKETGFLVTKNTGTATLFGLLFTSAPNKPGQTVTIINPLDYPISVSMETPGPNITLTGQVHARSVTVLEWIEEAAGEFTLVTRSSTSYINYTGFSGAQYRRASMITTGYEAPILEANKLTTIIGSTNNNTEFYDQTALIGTDPRASFPGSVALRSSVIAKTNRNFCVLGATSTAASTTYTLTADLQAASGSNNSWVLGTGVHRFKIDIIGAPASGSDFCRFEREVIVANGTLVTPSTTGLPSDVFSGTFFTGSTVTIDVLSDVLRVRVTTGSNATTSAFWTCFADHVVGFGSSFATS